MLSILETNQTSVIYIYIYRRIIMISLRSPLNMRREDVK